MSSPRPNVGAIVPCFLVEHFAPSRYPNAMTTLLITQARIGSSRFPQKILQKWQDKELLTLHLQRAAKARGIDHFSVATTFETGVEKIQELARENHFDCAQGDLHDVLDRFYQCALPYRPDTIIRLTSDCPLIDPLIIEEALELFQGQDLDYLCNTLPPTFPDGQDVEVFSFSALERAHKEAEKKYQREHVTPYIWENSNLKESSLFKASALSNAQDKSDLRMTVDTPEDFEVISKLLDIRGPYATWRDYAEVLETNPEIRALNDSQERNSGFKKEE